MSLGVRRMQPPNRRASSYNPMAVNPLTAIVRLFVNTFGITQPSPETEERAGRVILAMLVGVVVMLALVAFALRSALVR
jgi:ABC-type amino acid transport system permease subunit